MNAGNTVFSQLMSLIHDYELRKCIDRYRGDFHARRFTCRDWLGIDNMVYAFDSSTINLCLQLCPWAKFHHDKGAFKIHTLIDVKNNIPNFIMLTPGNVHDTQAMDSLPVEAGAYYLMDKGYVDFDRLFRFFQQQKAYFVTRAKCHRPSSL